jgi:hypothetical protein
MNEVAMSTNIYKRDRKRRDEAPGDQQCGGWRFIAQEVSQYPGNCGNSGNDQILLARAKMQVSEKGHIRGIRNKKLES